MNNPLHFRSFFKFLGRNKLYTFINIFGLSVSLMFVILIAVYTRQELSIDGFQEKSERIYGIGNEHFIGSGYGLATYLLDRYPEIEKVSATHTEQSQPVQLRDNRYNAELLFVDSTFYDIFSFRMIEGVPENILRSKSEVILSESFARKLFGNENPIGQSLTINENLPVTVGGVTEDYRNTVIPYGDIILNMELVESHFNAGISNKHMANAGGVSIFILAREGTDLVSKIPDMEEYFKDIFWIYERGIWEKVTLTPLKDIYFSPLEVSDNLGKGNKSMVMILISVGILILIFAIINYINLTVAQTGFRAKEMATRRLLGAEKGEIFWKFILESTIMVAFAFIIGLLLAGALEGPAGRVLNTRVNLWDNLTPGFVILAVVLVIFLGIVSGIIPSAFISRYKPLDVVKGTFRQKSKMVFSKVFIVFQNVITISLIAGSITMLLQIRHMINAPLGYNIENIIEVKSSGMRSMDMVNTFQNEVRQLAAVQEVSKTLGTPLDRGNNHTVEYKGKNISFQTFMADSAFFRIMGFEILEDYRQGAVDGYWINEKSLAELELEPGAINFRLWEEGEPIPIMGILKNFKLGDMIDSREEAVLLHIYRDNNFWPWQFLIKYEGDGEQVYNDIKNIYEKLTGLDFSIDGKFMEKEMEERYAGQKRILSIVTIFTIIGILISMLGLIAMSTYFIQQRASEIAVRKVFGSTRGEVFRKLVFNFLKLVLIAFVLAVPIIWMLMRWWLSDYSYRINLNPLIFLGAGLLALLIAAITVSWQSARAANRNPIDSIRNEQ